MKGSKFLVQVTDYAMNTATYKVEVQTGEQEELPEMIAFDLDKGCWTSLYQGLIQLRPHQLCPL